MPPPPKFWKRRKGFTLAELLICLAILGVIAIFTIPKVLTSVQNNQKATIFKEIIATFSQAAYNANTLGDSTYFPTHINALKICTGNSSTQGCFTQAYTGPSAENNQAGYILHNGANVAGFDWYNASATGIVIDWNGPGAPNIYGDDQLGVMVCFDLGTPCTTGRYAGSIWPKDATSITLWNQIFQ